MRKKNMLLVSSILSIGLVLGGIPHQNQASAKSIQKKEVLVVYKNAKGKQDAIKSSEKIKHQFKALPAVSVTADTANIQKLENNPDIASVETKYCVSHSGFEKVI
ncbi:protease inhibitor I9 family protein [Metabacillus sp. RGM 3146]|uniref:protease inhibitor I9 family protein n=1 Tax=Metabacillus sp. RGM 3146 TaxID=3401092 RepID=UPI003B9C0303